MGWVGRGGRRAKCVSRAQVVSIDTLYMYGHLHEPINTLVIFFVPIPFVIGNP
jgi:hypothetical protein